MSAMTYLLPMITATAPAPALVPTMPWELDALFSTPARYAFGSSRPRPQPRSVVAPSRRSSATPTATTHEPPDFPATSSVRVVYDRRELEVQRDRLVAERATLMQKRFSPSGLDHAELKRLRYVDWCLDRIDSTAMADSLERLESLVARQERLATALEENANEARRLTAGKSGRRRRPSR